jgi:DNA polymerase-3 subunit gamma/tau
VARALYNTYRPRTFSEVVGQEHVTAALQTALTSGRLHHAFLFSGPRGCGKTSSARILAASLNCEQGPTPTPCGVCEQCVAIRNGSSMDVIEIDAASHGGVDDARDLRERAAFGPVSARYKIYVVDEAHMVTREGFNALLKLVEEPPSYLKFVFATTEPDKVIQTIRSRTHHYAFRLVPPSVLQRHLEWICEQEQATVDPRVLPMVVRAGGGSVRDALSVLDQLLAAAGPDGLTYDMATAVLGVTPAVLLDDTVDALAAHDGATVFGVAGKVADAGHDPRRFLSDLLTRLRDLIVLDAVPDASERGLLEECSEDQLVRMRTQATQLGAAGLSRAADIVHDGLLEMKGTASPRLLLELVLARALLPAAARDDSSMLVRLDRLERRVELAGDVPPAQIQRAPSAAPASEPPRPAPAPQPAAAAAAPDSSPAASPATPAAVPSTDASSPTATVPAASSGPTSGSPAATGPEPSAGTPSPGVAPRPAPANGSIDAAALRRVWDQVLAAVRNRRRSTQVLLSGDGHIIDVRGNEIVLGFDNPNLARTFREGFNAEPLAEAVGEVIGGHWRITVGTGAGSGGSPSSTGLSGTGSSDTGSSGGGIPAGQPTSYAPPASSPAQGPAHGFAPGDEAMDEVPPDDDDPDADSQRGPTVSGEDAAVALLQRGLGAKVIEEITPDG